MCRHAQGSRFYFGNVELAYYGVDEQGIPAPLDRRDWDEIDGWVVANVTPLQGVYVPLNALAPVRLKDPVARIGWTMYVYDLRKPSRHAVAFVVGKQAHYRERWGDSSVRDARTG